MIWVASSPLSGDGHVNVSPKGGEYFGVIDDKTFWYQGIFHQFYHYIYPFDVSNNPDNAQI